MSCTSNPTGHIVMNTHLALAGKRFNYYYHIVMSNFPANHCGVAPSCLRIAAGTQSVTLGWMRKGCSRSCIATYYSDRHNTQRRPPLLHDVDVLQLKVHSAPCTSTTAEQKLGKLFKQGVLHAAMAGCSILTPSAVATRALCSKPSSCLCLYLGSLLQCLHTFALLLVVLAYSQTWTLYTAT